MNVSGFRVYRFRLRLVAPLLLAGETLRMREGLLLELEGDGGISGWGEASPLPGFSTEGIDDAERALVDLASRVLGRDVSASLSTPSNSPPSTRFGLEAALWSLRATAEGLAPPEALSPEARRIVAGAALLSGPRERVLADAVSVGREGYEAVKLKVGVGTVDEDAALALEVAGLLAEGVALRLDANRAWRPEEAERFVGLLDGMPIAYLEEPLTRPEGLAGLARRTGAPVALDESLVGLEPEALGDHLYAKAVVLKPTMLGLSRALRFAKEASRLGMTPVVSAAYESGVGTAALVALAAAVGDAPAGLDTYRRLAEDVILPRLPLPCPTIDVERFVSASLAIDRSTLELVGEGP